MHLTNMKKPFLNWSNAKETMVSGKISMGLKNKYEGLLEYSNRKRNEKNRWNILIE